MFIGIDIGGSKTLVASSTDGIKLGRQRKFPTPQHDDSAMDVIVHQVKTLAGKAPVWGIGVVAPGAIDFKRGLMLKQPNLSWQNVDVKSALEKQFHAPVVVEGDAAAAGLAEATHGAARGHSPVLYVTISTGVGTGLIIDGKVYHGAANIEGGHITVDPSGPICSCGGQGHFEALVSGRAIERRFGRPAFEIKDTATWNLIAKDMAVGLASLITTTAPRIVVLGGGVSVHWNRFRKPLAEHLATYASGLYPLPHIVPAKNVETAAIMGALLLASRTKN